MPIPLMALGAVASGVGSFARGIFGGKQNKKANQINPQWQQYTTSPFAKSQLALAQQMFGGRAAGSGAQEQNIMNNQASTLGNINRNTTDAARALALTGAVQGQTNDAFANLGMQEAQNKQSMLGNLNQAYGTMTGELDKEYQSKLQKYMMDKQEQLALRDAGAKNQFGALNDIAGLFGTLGMGQQQNSFWKQLLGNKSSGAGGRAGAIVGSVIR
jgi:hypothetical protein